MDEKHNIHLPSPSFWPVTLAFALGLVATGVVSTYFVSLAGVVLMLVAIAGWTMENRRASRENRDE